MKKNKNDADSEQSIVTHLVELRDRLLKVIFAILIVFVGLFPFANDLYTILASPLMSHLPEGSTMIATEVASPFLTPFKFTLVLSVFAVIPVLLYQVWAFIAPGLYHDEKELVFPLLVSSSALFYVGMAFAYFVVFPLVFGFLTGVAPEGVSVMTDITKYLDFVLKMFFAFGLAFEVPIATILLVWVGAVTPDQLVAKRAYVIVGAFVVGMLLTPPDIISQTLLAFPMWVLFEIGVFFSRSIVKKRRTRFTGTDDSTDGTPEDSQEKDSGYGDVDGHSYQDELSAKEMDEELDRLEKEDGALDDNDDIEGEDDKDPKDNSDKDPK